MLTARVMSASENTGCEFPTVSAFSLIGHRCLVAPLFCRQLVRHQTTCFTFLDSLVGPGIRVHEAVRTRDS